MTTALSVEAISKQYRLGTLGARSALTDIRRWLRHVRHRPVSELSEAEGAAGQLHTIQRESGVSRPDSYIWALRDISFEVVKGEAVGIIGRNGAGKSTLLKILSRVTAPTKGVVKARGRISSLLEVGTGFHPELTGRENTYLNGAILGMSRAEVRQKFDEIVDFSGVEQFIDTPVKRYSSGMYVRLAFAVAAHLEPEILVVDEVLAVGDTAFQQKCLGKMDEVAHAGRTILFVSHTMSAIAQLCNRAFWLDKGKIVQTGSATSVVQAYLSKSTSPRRVCVWDKLETAPGNETVRLTYAAVEAAAGHDPDYWTVETPLIMTFRFTNHRPDLPMHVEMKLFNKDGICAFQSASARERRNRGVVEAQCNVPPNLLNDGAYSVTISAHYVGTYGVAVEAALAFEVSDVPREIFPADKWPGVVRPQLDWRIRQIGPVPG